MTNYILLGTKAEIADWKQRQGVVTGRVYGVTPGSSASGLRGLSGAFEVLTFPDWRRASTALIEAVERDLAIIRCTQPPTPTPAEELRAAAAKIRKHAEAASPGPWHVKPVVYGPADQGWGPPRDFEVYGPGLVSNNDRCVVSHVQHEGGGADETDAAHIALWNPAVALLVAELLEGMADHWHGIAAEDEHLFGGLPLASLARAINASGKDQACAAL